ncbi:hypothetical protein ON010_g14516 [Phytophthora cinnamomi]|nr:hypothetical protein ON010_g14516 [Phytophthora cinnamomi]
MGGGQQEKALNLLKSTAEHGEWLCLQNLHLVIAWLPVLEKEFSALNGSHKFRLWLTTEPHDAFPLVLLEQSLKITFESPPGMKKNLQRTYAAWNPDFIAKGSSARAQLLFLLAWFHALLQERRTYIPQGWTKFYEFSFGDFRAGSNVMELACQTSGGGSSGIDWQTLHGLMENAIYGGRIDNPYDLRVLRCNLTEYFGQELLSGQKSLMRGVKLPQSSQHADYLDIIDRFPDLDAPAMFGLPDNIERSMQRSLSGQVIAQLKALSSSEAEATTFDREKWRAQLGPLLETWGKLTTGFQLEGTSSSSSSGKNLQAMAPADAFVAQENEYALDLVQQVNSSLQALKKVIYGTGLLTPAIQTVAIALLKGAVPAEWSSQWEGSENVATWLRGLAMRKRALSEWQEAVGTGQLLTKGLDLSDLLHPGTFLNALRQQSAREQKCSMDGMKLLSCWERERLSGTKVEWFELTRLLLQGASFEGGTLLEAVSDAQELVAVPSCYVAFVREDAQEMYEKENCIKTPLYYATDRERMLVEISMPIAAIRTGSDAEDVEPLTPIMRMLDLEAGIPRSCPGSTPGKEYAATTTGVAPMFPSTVSANQVEPAVDNAVQDMLMDRGDGRLMDKSDDEEPAPKDGGDEPRGFKAKAASAAQEVNGAVEQRPGEVARSQSPSVAPAVARRRSRSRSADDIPISSTYHRVHSAEVAEQEAKRQEEQRLEAEQRERDVREYKASMQLA